jgi:hypothetical protein
MGGRGVCGWGGGVLAGARVGDRLPELVLVAELQSGQVDEGEQTGGDALA